jgi:tRNA-splicing ligase RtcB (3'-phosphate/5'-hydroxy nucleic acid ligase)
MAKIKIRGKDLKRIGYAEGPSVGIALQVMQAHFSDRSRSEQLHILEQVLQDPAASLDDDRLHDLAKSLLVKKAQKKEIPLRKKSLPYRVYGTQEIEAGTLNQMDIAMRLPVSIKGALMPDAHQGYGLPIGAVLAVSDVIIPYGVGMDIGCRMCLSVFSLSPEWLIKKKSLLKQCLLENTRFGRAEFQIPVDDAIFERKEFGETGLLKRLKTIAYKQAGTSGSGNHFVEFGEVELMKDNTLGSLKAGKYCALLSHSGSRNMGAEIARHYTKIAVDRCPLPSSAKHLAWLEMDSEPGMEYWKAMCLAGDYSSLNHRLIHDRITDSLHTEVLFRIENHHNFAWKEPLEDGREAIIHRKGATPAGKNDLGIIPGSMVLPAFIIRGKGNPESMNSAAHGAGRLFSRKKALATFKRKDLDQVLKKYGVELIGGGLDEVPMAYKNIFRVMEYQKDLVESLGTFRPLIVRME